MRRIPTRSKVLWIGWLAYFLVFVLPNAPDDPTPHDLVHGDTGGRVDG